MQKNTNTQRGKEEKGPGFCSFVPVGVNDRLPMTHWNTHHQKNTSSLVVHTNYKSPSVCLRNRWKRWGVIAPQTECAGGNGGSREQPSLSRPAKCPLDPRSAAGATTHVWLKRSSVTSVTSAQSIAATASVRLHLHHRQEAAVNKAVHITADPREIFEAA